jgi:hypothetical protein
MKISAKTKLILVVGIIVIFVLIFAVYYNGKLGEQDKLEEDLAQAQQTLVTNSQQKYVLQQRLDQAAAADLMLTAIFPDSSQSMEVEAAVLGAADEAGVGLASISCTAPQAATLGGRSCQKFSMSVTAQGGVDNLLRFVSVLGQWLPTADVEAAGVNMADDENGALSLVFTVYAMRG